MTNGVHFISYTAYMISQCATEDLNTAERQSDSEYEFMCLHLCNV